MGGSTELIKYNNTPELRMVDLSECGNIPVLRRIDLPDETACRSVVFHVHLIIY